MVTILNRYGIMSKMASHLQLIISNLNVPSFIMNCFTEIMGILINCHRGHFCITRK